jgi:hypothetical protein
MWWLEQHATRVLHALPGWRGRLARRGRFGWRGRFSRGTWERHDVVDVVGLGQQGIHQRRCLVGRERTKVLRRPIHVRIASIPPPLRDLVDAELAARDRFPLQRTPLHSFGVALALQLTEREGKPIVLDLVWRGAFHCHIVPIVLVRPGSDTATILSRFSVA